MNPTGAKATPTIPNANATDKYIKKKTARVGTNKNSIRPLEITTHHKVNGRKARVMANPNNINGRSRRNLNRIYNQFSKITSPGMQVRYCHKLQVAALYC
jgi:hypothetical protein